MKKINLTVSYEEEKITALRWYLEQKGITLEGELQKAVDALFTRNVPASVRSYISKTAEVTDNAPRIRRPKPSPQPAVKDIPTIPSA